MWLQKLSSPKGCFFCKFFTKKWLLKPPRNSQNRKIEKRKYSEIFKAPFLFYLDKKKISSHDWLALSCSLDSNAMRF